MAYEMRENSGSLFKNDKKETESHPNAKGQALINGVVFWVSAWTKTDKNGNKWQSLSFKPKDEQAANSEPAKPRKDGGVVDELDNDLPF